jgi:RND family efflux transporter MFP subunit
MDASTARGAGAASSVWKIGLGGAASGALLLVALQWVWPALSPKGAAQPDPKDAIPPMVLSVDGPASAGPAASAASTAANNAASAKPAGPPQPPVSVSTVLARQQDVPVQVDAPGTVVALRTVDIKPQLSSVVAQVHVQEGQTVKAGQLLFTLDDRNEKARLAQAQAQLAKSSAAQADAQRQYQRSRELLEQKFVSQGSVDTALANWDAARAAVQADQANVEAAKVALSYTRIAAPGAGRVGAIAVYAGSSVAAQSTLLLTLTQLDPIGVSFSLPQQHLGALLQASKKGGAAVQVTSTEAGAEHQQGQLEFVDSVVDAASGTLKAKARLANAKQALWPGAFVQVRLTVGQVDGGVLVPQAAIIQSPKGRMVYTVDADKRAVPTPVKVVMVSGDEAVVTGVRAGQTVVLDGRQNLRPGSVVLDTSAKGPSAKAATHGAPTAGATAPKASPADAAHKSTQAS